jgi:hypothetical protein
MQGNPYHIPDYTKHYRTAEEEEYYLPPQVTHNIRTRGRPFFKTFNYTEPILNTVLVGALAHDVGRNWYDMAMDKYNMPVAAPALPIIPPGPLAAPLQLIMPPVPPPAGPGHMVTLPGVQQRTHIAPQAFLGRMLGMSPRSARSTFQNITGFNPINVAKYLSSTEHSPDAPTRSDVIIPEPKADELGFRPNMSKFVIPPATKPTINSRSRITILPRNEYSGELYQPATFDYDEDVTQQVIPMPVAAPALPLQLIMPPVLPPATKPTINSRSRITVLPRNEYSRELYQPATFNYDEDVTQQVVIPTTESYNPLPLYNNRPISQVIPMPAITPVTLSPSVVPAEIPIQNEIASAPPVYNPEVIPTTRPVRYMLAITNSQGVNVDVPFYDGDMPNSPILLYPMHHKTREADNRIAKEIVNYIKTNGYEKTLSDLGEVDRYKKIIHQFMDYNPTQFYATVRAGVRIPEPLTTLISDKLDNKIKSLYINIQPKKYWSKSFKDATEIYKILNDEDEETGVRRLIESEISKYPNKSVNDITSGNVELSTDIIQKAQSVLYTRNK